MILTAFYASVALRVPQEKNVILNTDGGIEAIIHDRLATDQ
jgi:hypothetical protein